MELEVIIMVNSIGITTTKLPRIILNQISGPQGLAQVDT